MKSFQWFTVSIAFHMIIFIIMSGLYIKAPTNKNLVEIDYVNSSTPAKDRQIVDTKENLTQKVEDLKKRARFLSKKTQRITKEQTAKINKKTLQEKRQQQQRSLLPKIRHDLLGAVTERNNAQQTPHFATTPSNVSRSLQSIPNVKTGNFTALNTDQFIFYAFYSRINQQIGQRWVQKVRHFVNESRYNQLIRLSKKPSTTVVEFLIDEEGKFVKTVIKKSSGSHELDLAGIKAFTSSAPFHHPPSEMIQQDGYIHLKYSFQVLWDPKYITKK